MQATNINHVTEPGGNPRLFKRGEYLLVKRRLGWVIPDGDGWEDIPPTEQVWNHVNPLAQKIRVRGPRRQISARMARRIETMDSVEVAVLDESGNIVRYERRVGEARPYTGGVTGTNFAVGAKYAGGQRTIKRAQLARKLGLETPAPRSEPKNKREAEIAKLEARIRELLGQ